MNKKEMRARIAELEGKLNNQTRYIDHLEGRIGDLRMVMAKYDQGDLVKEMHDLLDDAANARFDALGAAMAQRATKEKQGRGSKAASDKRAARSESFKQYQYDYFDQARKKLESGSNERDACGAARVFVLSKMQREICDKPGRNLASELFPTFEKWPDSEKV